ncbi:metal ABC transporter permease [Microaerobacter geothermalis]|uniref:metal ABC transporter permease n=1 Tax=Microaerobacter geothermalis TaxID=674972 RepID=UPI001F43E19B|nr:metal ABC transporter permease [Microaerobacter geothermalis]MCF6093407.1 metal ABC transporter permease [Microaerobacter geothermalis]
MISFLLQYEFAQRALLTGILIGAITPLVGVFIVARRLSVIGEVLSQMNLAGMAFGSILGASVSFFQPIGPAVYGMLFAVIGALLVEVLRRIYRHFSELTIPIILSFSLGLSVVLFSASGGFNADFYGYLFGNLMAVTQDEFKLTIGVAILVLVTISLFYKDFLILTFDEEYASASGVRIRLVQWIFILLMALVISVAVRAVGVLLVSGLMVLPVAAMWMLPGGFRKIMWLSVLVSELSILIGFAASYYFNLASGGAIIWAAFLILLMVMVGRRWLRKH